MKIIEALKQGKDLLRKASDIRDKVAKYSAHLNVETPMYTDQTRQVNEWIQSHTDILKEVLRLRVAIQRTNMLTQVTIELNGQQVTKSIAEWIHRRRELATLERACWAGLTDKGLREGFATDSQNEKREVKIVRCYNPAVRDTQIELLTSEPSIIDSRLEVVNAVSDLIEK
jgi:hypothetical protein